MSSLSFFYTHRALVFLPSFKSCISKPSQGREGHQAKCRWTKWKQLPGDTWKNFAFLIKTSPFLHVALFSIPLYCSEKAGDRISGIHEVTLWLKVISQKWRSRKRGSIWTLMSLRATVTVLDGWSWSISYERKTNPYLNNWLWFILCSWKLSYLT